mmetsp:Transcript_48949/g.122638  ORF Transcript_48949/g.122638 Transcript_48949/m.122638 type:complete len:208 (+) Transcript_48949:320-943(+)
MQSFTSSKPTGPKSTCLSPTRPSVATTTLTMATATARPSPTREWTTHRLPIILSPTPTTPPSMAPPPAQACSTHSRATWTPNRRRGHIPSGTTNINTSKGSSSGASAIKQQHHQQQRGRSSSSASLGGGGGRLHRSDSNVSHNHANVNDENDDDRALPVLPAKKALGVSSGVVGGGLGSGKVAMAVASPTGSYHADLLPVMQGDQDD